MRRAKKRGHPCAYCGKPFVRRTISPVTQRYCTENCRKRASLARQRTKAAERPARMVERRRVVIDGRVAYIAGLGNEGEKIRTTCNTCGAPVEWGGKGRPPRFCSAKCRVASSRKNKTPETVAAWKEKRK